MILIDNRQEKIEFSKENEDVISKLIDYALKEEGVNIEYEISVILIDNAEIRKINKENRDIDSVTDVLSFPMLEYPEKKFYKDVYTDTKFSDAYLDDGKLVLGDIALSLETAKEQSDEFGHSFIRECAYLVIHSVLHLLGYDHMEIEDKLIMRKREEEILNKFNINR
ncbi:probable rRNA maturation factor [Clostridium acidisoli DSM 12555]|uniref:Endoribonuclease YbeY n=1 Tax=Clostridium acidisoli DSM 12555 TaxID=1121291 RepID=A0A1W1X4U7_9CLOT|nr:rRNA maturation RNase YbeY [Clostridium acidisoli]SMC18922.1 probable rRNA maturation factor [Clostridium acidisoli DSM 12555]